MIGAPNAAAYTQVTTAAHRLATRDQHRPFTAGRCRLTLVAHPGPRATEEYGGRRALEAPRLFGSSRVLRNAVVPTLDVACLGVRLASAARVSRASRNYPGAVMNLTGDGHERCPVAARGSQSTRVFPGSSIDHGFAETAS